MDVNQAMGQIRPILAIAGSILIAAGLLKFFGLEIAVAGWLLKGV